MKQNASLFERDTVRLRVFQKRKKMNSQKCSRENWKGLKTDQVCPKHAIFATETSRVQVARTSRQNTKKKNLENFLTVFRDWKFHSWESCKLSCENLYVPLTTGPSTHKQVANLSREKHENPNFEKYFKSFLRLKHLPANESPVSRGESLWWTCDWGMWLVLLATESPEQGKTIFWNFDNFCKNKVLSKNN